MIELDFTAQELFDQLITHSENAMIEAKKGREIGSSVMQSICAFANEPDIGGGYILLGVAEPDEHHHNFWLCGVQNSDELLNQLQINCREMFDNPIPIIAQQEWVNDTTQTLPVIVVYVPELVKSAKPCGFIGKFDSKNKRKTGVWRRGVNGDYECTQQELEPLLLGKIGSSFDEQMVSDSDFDDLDPYAIAKYRELRAKVRPEAEELQASDEEMLYAMKLVKKHKGQYIPTVAGLLLMGKRLSLRRLMPENRVDYVRMAGIRFEQENIISTLDMREALIFLIPKLEAEILNDMPRYFQLENGQLQRSDVPIIPQKAVREVLVNALMHRDYLTKSPTMIVRYDNRLELKNVGYSLKSEDEWGTYGSRLRNPTLGAVLYDLNFAETKGSGVGKIRKALKEADLTMPLFFSDVPSNRFQATLLLHQLLSEQHLAWLKNFKRFSINDDEAKTLIIAKETGIVNNQAICDISDLEKKEVTVLLNHLVADKKLLQKQGYGRWTFYTLSELALEVGAELGAELGVELGVELGAELGVELPENLQQMIVNLPNRIPKEQMHTCLIKLCQHKPYTLPELANFMNKKEKSIRKHIKELMNVGELTMLYPDIPNHPYQAYKSTQQSNNIQN